MPINPHNPFRAGPFGEVLAVVDTTGALTQYDSAGAHLLFGSGVQSVGLAFGPFGEVLEVVGATGTLTQYDSAGTHLLFGSGVESAGVAFGPFGEVLAVVSDNPTTVILPPSLLWTGCHHRQ